MSVAFRKPQSASPASSRIEAVQSELERANRELAELTEKRNAALLRDDNAAAIELGVKIANLKLSARAHEDKIGLLREVAAREEQARREKEREVQIGKIEAEIKLRDKDMEQVAAALKQLAAASERVHERNRKIVAAWTWQPHDLAPALLSPPSIMTAISHETYRLSYHPRRYGGMDTDPLAGIMLPGSKSIRLEWVEQPERTRPLLDVVRDASEFAKQFLRTGKSSSAVEVVAALAPVMNGSEPVQRSEAEQRLGALLKQQAELAEDVTPAGETEYQRVVSKIAKVQAVIMAEQAIGAQGHG
jgi:hypothetical protein